LADRSRGEKPALRIHQAIAHDLGAAILAGRFKPGQPFEGEIEHSELLKVSRSAYREALRILIAKGLLESRPRIGTRVTSRDRWNFFDPDILAWMFEGEPDERFIRDLFELRGVIEPGAAALAAERRSDAQLGQMAQALQAMRSLTLATPAGRAADQQFHRTVLEAADNEPLKSLSSSIAAAVSWTTKFKQRRRKLPRDPVPDHVAVYEAILAKDTAGARAAMVELLRLALADMRLPPRS
jgi:DNA-binding FadR family transcriptional regulator